MRDRKKNSIKRAVRTVFALAAAASLSVQGPASVKAHAAEYVRRFWTDTSVSAEQHEAVMNILRTTAGQDTGGLNTIMYDTGLGLGEGVDGYQFCYNFRELFLGRDDFGVCYNDEGFSSMTAEIVESSMQGIGLRFHATGPTSGIPSVFAGWLPGSNPAECLRQHDEAAAVLRQVAAGAPADDAEAYRYFFDWLCQRVTFDEEYKDTSHSAYSAVVEGSSVCEGYAKAFEALCWMTGRYCRSVTVEGDGRYGLHERNLVFLNGEPKWVDVTWGDRPEGPAYEYLLYDVDILWRQRLGI